MMVSESRRVSATSLRPAAPSTSAPDPQHPGGGVRATATSKSNRPTSATASLVVASVKESSVTLSEAANTTTHLERVLQIGQPIFSTQLDFIKANRAVASLERAVERLELLSLLDTAGTTLDTEGNHSNANGTGTPTNARAVDATGNASLHPRGASRGPAVLTGAGHDASVATAKKVAEVLAISQQQRRCGRASVLELLAEQRVLERRYGELLIQAQPTVSLHPGVPHLRPQCFAHVRDPAQMALERELALVSARLRDTNRLLCTQLQDNPQDMDNWAKVSNGRRELTALLKQVIEELTVGYKSATHHQHSRQYQQSASSLLDSALRGGKASLGASEDGRSGLLATEEDSLGPNSSSLGGPGLTRNGSRQSSMVGGGVTGDSIESGSRASPFLRGFGSTLPRCHQMRPMQQAPRIPLLSSYQQFAVKILQEEASQRWADDVLAKERALNQNVKQLQSDLVREQELKDKEVSERQARISALRLELRQLKATLQQRAEAAKARGEAATENLQREGSAEVRVVREEMQHYEQLLMIGAETHEAFSAYLLERTAAMDGLASEWEAKTLQELKKKEAAKIDAEGNRQACAQRLTDLEHQQEVQQELKEKREAVQKAEEDTRRRAEDQQSAEYVAASVLQAALKAMMTRQALRKLQKGSKKKKKKE
ncbi:hypothetical protein JKF63_00692 [Porcisia hertigi]|uniref:Dynein regulatory complex protein 9 n=1 Tax=Porcisia hertigi TaxID=2761500 RepID=A0A836GYS0_9TRYP|nr:hypothetical protein JKF63_00692 [Porcisia hertigi]